jgi:hypothetical protein
MNALTIVSILRLAPLAMLKKEDGLSLDTLNILVVLSSEYFLCKLTSEAGRLIDMRDWLRELIGGSKLSFI